MTPLPGEEKPEPKTFNEGRATKKATSSPLHDDDLAAAMEDGQQAAAPAPYNDIEAAFGIGEEDIPVAEALIVATTV